MKKIILLVVCLLIISPAFAQKDSFNIGQSEFGKPQTGVDKYPKSAERPLFKNTSHDSLRTLKVIEIFQEGNAPQFGYHATGVEVINNNVYIGENKQNKVLVFDKDQYNYKFSIGNENRNAADFLNGLFGPLQWKGKLMVGSRQQPNLFNSFSPNGDFEKSYKNKSPFNWRISSSNHNALLYDSIAYIVKSFADNKYKVSRLKFSDDFEKIGNDILPVSDFHIPLDSAKSMNIITSLYLLKSNLADEFYAIPSNKYLINSYNLEGKLLYSADLRNVPEIGDWYKLQEEWLGIINSYFQSVAIDKDDNIYIPVEGISNPEIIYKELTSSNTMLERLTILSKLNKEIKMNFYLIAVNLKKREYKKYAVNSPITPMKVIDGKLWCYDYKSSKIVIFKLPQ